MNVRTEPIATSLTDEFVEMCEEDPGNIFMRLARTSGLPEGVDPCDHRIIKLFDVIVPDVPQRPMAHDDVAVGPCPGSKE